MNQRTKRMMLLGVSVGAVLLSLSGVTTRGTKNFPLSHQRVTATVPAPANPESQVSKEDVEALKIEMKRLKSDRQEAERHTAGLERELASLRLPSPHNDQNQRDDASQLTPEEELQQVEAQSWMQADLLEGVMLAETVDPQWANEAESALGQVFLTGKVQGLQLVDTECRATLCRLTLARDSKTSPEEGFRALLHHAPWQGQGFVRIDYGDSTDVVVYLAREGHELLQVTK